MRGVLNSEDLKIKHEFQDLSYRLMKMRHALSSFFEPFPDSQKAITRALESNSILFTQVQGLDSQASDTIQTLIGNLEQLVRLVGNALDFYEQSEREPAFPHIRMLEKIIVKLRNYEDMAYKKGFGRSVA
ncbi:MAG: hypothetical protein H6858_07600 [Rhodospirillales bacterium]|nr:hypothetical protein [Alphaproteobacteria bacterium]MCB1839131.1 hypothetical protein [Alphaproteobacteria bacterium]MCB9977445.1 hypothetical protein [Rhodospirillales bacterium]